MIATIEQFMNRPSTLRRRIGRIALTLAGAAGMAAMAPEPDAVPRRWQLEIELGELRMVTFDTGTAGPRRYFYTTYKVTNNSGQDVLFAPAFDMADGSGSVTRSGRDVPGAVTSKLLEQARNPYIQDQIGIIGEIRQGEENAKDGLAVWPASTLNPSEITVYIGGLSGETATVTAPDGKTKFVLRKTLKLDYNAPGDLTKQGATPIALEAKSWIMR